MEGGGIIPFLAASLLMMTSASVMILEEHTVARLIVEKNRTADEYIEGYKGRLFAQDFLLTFGVDYFAHIFSLLV